MFKRYNFFCWIVFLSLILVTCKKSDSAKFHLGNLDLAGVYGLVISNDSVNPSNKILYKLSNSDRLDPLVYLNTEGYNMGGYYAPQYFYALNEQYFFATFSIIGSNPIIIESFIIKYLDGKAFKLPAGFYPMKMIEGVWKQDPYEKPIKAGPNNSFYFRGEDRVFKITQTALDLFETEVIDISGTSADVFDVDLEGDIMVGSKIYTSPMVWYQSQVYETSNSMVTSSFNNPNTNIGGFSVIKLVNNNIQTFHLHIQNNSLKEDTVSTIVNHGSGWLYRGSYKFQNPNQLIHVFDKGMVKVNADGASLVVLDNNLTINSIEMSDQSVSLLYLAATSDKGKIFLQINPASIPFSYLQVFAPNRYIINHFNVLWNDNVVFDANVLSGNTNIFGYYSASLEKEVINYQNITASQLITVK